MVIVASTTAAAPTTSENCTETGTGSAYRLTGKREKELKSFVGRKMEITGRFDHARDARTAAGQTNAKLPAEILIASYRQASGPVSETPTATSGSVAPPPAEAPMVEPSGELPKSASDEPLLALISLASFSAALGVRFVRRRAS